MEDFELAHYIYWEYSLGVMVVTELVRILTKNVKAKIIQLTVVDNPKWLTLIVAGVLAVLDWSIIGSANKFHIWQFIISFGCAVLGYDYVVKLIKDQFKKPSQ